MKLDKKQYVLHCQHSIRVVWRILQWKKTLKDHQEADIPQEEAARQEAVIHQGEAPAPGMDTETVTATYPPMNRHPI